MLTKTVLIATAMLFCAGIARAGDAAPVSGSETTNNPGSVFVLQQPITDDDDGDIESVPDFPIFEDNGFQFPKWQTYGPLVKDVLDNVVLPDYRQRKGRDPAFIPSIDIASVAITGGDYNDLLVRSRLEGDCVYDGCLVQLYSLVGKVWVKRFEITAPAFGWKDGPKRDSPVTIASIGDNLTSSKTYTWENGMLKP